MKRYILDGNVFSDIQSFYDEVNRVLCPKFDGFGRNLDAFNDVLRGGFGEYEYGESFELVWLNGNKSKKDLGLLFDDLAEIIHGHQHIRFIVTRI